MQRHKDLFNKIEIAVSENLFLLWTDEPYEHILLRTTQFAPLNPEHLKYSSELFY